MLSRSAMQGWLRCSSPQCQFGLLSLDQITQLLCSKTSPYHDSLELLLYMAAGVWTHNWNAASYQHLSPGRPLSLSRAGTGSSSNSISEAPAVCRGNQACLCADTFPSAHSLLRAAAKTEHQMGGLLRSGVGSKDIFTAAVFLCPHPVSLIAEWRLSPQVPPRGSSHTCLHLGLSFPSKVSRHRTSLPTSQCRSSTHRWPTWICGRRLLRVPSIGWESSLPAMRRQKKKKNRLQRRADSMQKRTKQHSLEHWGMLFSLWKETSNFKVNLFDSMGPLSTLSQPISICRLPTNWLSWRFVVWMLFECWDMYRINISIMLHWLVGEYSSSISKSERGRNRQLWSRGRLWSNESFMQIAAEVMPFFFPSMQSQSCREICTVGTEICACKDLPAWPRLRDWKRCHLPQIAVVYLLSHLFYKYYYSSIGRAVKCASVFPFPLFDFRNQTSDHLCEKEGGKGSLD